MPKLKNEKWELFARAYISNYGNASQAARDAGYDDHRAGQQGSRLRNNATVRARIKELGSDLDSETWRRMENAYGAIADQAWKLAASDDPRASSAAVQALRLLADLQLLGAEGEKLRQNRDKLDMEKERLELQKKQLEAGESAKDVRITLDSSLMDAIK